MKRFLGIFLALVMAFSLTACNVFGSSTPIDYDKSEFEEVGGVKIADNGKYCAGTDISSTAELGKFVAVAEGGDGDGFGIGNVYLSGSERTAEEEKAYSGDNGGLGKFENGEKIKLFFRWSAWKAEGTDRFDIFIVPNYLDIKDSYEIVAYKNELAVCADKEMKGAEAANATADLKSLSAGQTQLTIDPNWWNSGYFNMVFVFEGEVLGYIPFEWISPGESVDYGDNGADAEPVTLDEYFAQFGLKPSDILPEGYTDAEVKGDNAVQFNPNGADFDEWKAKVSEKIVEISDNGKCGDISDAVSFEYNGATYWILASVFSETEWFIQITQ